VRGCTPAGHGQPRRRMRPLGTLRVAGAAPTQLALKWSPSPVQGCHLVTPLQGGIPLAARYLKTWRCSRQDRAGVCERTSAEPPEPEQQRTPDTALSRASLTSLEGRTSGVRAHEPLRQRRSGRASLFVYPLMSAVISSNTGSRFLARLPLPLSFCQQLPLRAGRGRGRTAANASFQGCW